MARPFLQIKDLNDKSKNIRIGVRINALWIVQRPPKSPHLEMIVNDSQGVEIQIGVKKDEYKEWIDKLEEGKTYIMENFTIVPNQEKFKACKHPYRMYFIGGTFLREKEIENMPPFSFHFASFADILANKLPTNYLIDLIGMIEDINHSDAKRVSLALRDNGQNYIQCTIWDQYAQEFMDFWGKINEKEGVVIIVRRARIKEPQGKYGISVSNMQYNNITQLITDQEFHQIKDFKKSFGNKTIVPVITEQALSQMSSFSEFDDLDKFMYKAKPMSLSSICNTTPTEKTSFLTIGETDDFVYHKGGWFFDGCSNNKCGKKKPDKETAESYTCVCNRFNKVAVPRYKLEIIVKSKDASAKMTFFDDHCSKVLGISAEDLRNQMLEIGEGDRKCYPQLLEKMLNKKFALRLGYNSTWDSLSVQRCSLDSQYINAIQDQLDDIEGTSKTEDDKLGLRLLMPKQESPKEENSINVSQEDSQEAIHFTTQDLSFSSENDPEKITHITPAKREITQEGLDENLEDGASEQLSTNKIKLKKIIKT